MKILYACSFSTHQGSGKSRATQQKLEALRRSVDNLVVLSPIEVASVLGKLTQAFFLEIKIVWCLLRSESGFQVFVSRGYVGFFSIMIARLRGIWVVREVHANSFEEANILGKTLVARFMLRSAAALSYVLDRCADMRVFNNPSLLEWYRYRGAGGNNDVYVYNGCDPSAKSYLSRDEARERLDLPSDKKLLVFVGSASIWHGVDYLVGLQQLFDINDDNYQIVCGGGMISREIDPDKRLLNIAPLDDAGCADLIRAADACLLPVKNIRVSPGSPLKLYDYILNGAFVIAQDGAYGYSDEVLRYGVGITVDFTKADYARENIIKIISEGGEVGGYDVDAIVPYITWDARMKEWINAIERLQRDV